MFTKNLFFTFLIALLFIAIELKAQTKPPIQDKNWSKRQTTPLVKWKFSFQNAVSIDSNDIAKLHNEQIISVPHTWNNLDVLDAYPKYYRGVGIYETLLPAAKISPSDKFLLHFEAANINTKVKVNGKTVGVHKGGFTAFEFDITPFLTNGKINLITIEVDNKEDSCGTSFYSNQNAYGGIYRAVSLIKKNKEATFKRKYASPDVLISFPKVAESQSQVSIKINLEGKLSGKFLSYELKDKQGNGRLSAIKTKGELRNLKPISTLNFSVRDVELWSVDSPTLYPLTIKLYDAKRKLIDSVSYKIAFRTYSFSADSGFILNGKPIKLQGTNRHQDWLQKGSAITPSQHLIDARLIKSIGANFVKTSNYPQSNEFLNACDSLGILVWEDLSVVHPKTSNQIVFSPCFMNNAFQELEEMIAQHKHHPSIIIWGIMNEQMPKSLRSIPYASSHSTKKNKEIPAFQSFILQLNAKAKQLDATRFTAYTFNQSYHKFIYPPLYAVPDIVAFNLVNSIQDFNSDRTFAFIDSLHNQYPKKPLLIGAFGLGVEKRIYSNFPELMDFSQEGAILYYQNFLAQLSKRSFLAGAAQWSFSDFQQENISMVSPYLSSFGLVYANRLPKSVFYLFKAFWDSKERFTYFLSEPSNKRLLFLPAGKDVYQDTIRFFSNEKQISISLNAEKMVIPVYNGVGKASVALRPGLNKLAYFSNNKLIETSIEGILLNPYDNRFRWQFNLRAGFHLYEPAKKKFWIGINDALFKKMELLSIDGFSHRTAFSSASFPIADTLVYGTDLSPVYQTSADSISTIKIKIKEPGSYGLILHFADLSSSSKNVFDVSINNQKAFSALYPAGEGKGVLRVTQKIVAFDVSPDDFLRFEGKIVISFKALEGKAFCNALELERIK